MPNVNREKMEQDPLNNMRFLSRTPIRTFLIYPLIVLTSELIVNKGALDFEPLFLPLMIWGFFQYRLCGIYRMKRGGGGPGVHAPPERLVSTGFYAYTRNPMYLGHIIFLAGLTLTLKSWIGAAITILVVIWFHRRVLSDEKKLVHQLGRPYIDYTNSVKRWIPGLF